MLISKSVSMNIAYSRLFLFGVFPSVGPVAYIQAIYLTKID